jgi:aspartokinase-like uncharacterized kinase
MPTEPGTIRVVKIGGSLLDFELFSERIQDWLQRHPEMKTVFVVGGGNRADQVRQWEQRFALEVTESHWNCIEMMEVNSVMVASWFSNWVWIDEFDELSRPSGPVVFATKKWLLNLQPPLPESWEVTSDSVAAQLASELKAKELVLLKSAEPPGGAGIESLVESGYLDKYFPVVAAGQSVRLVNLRARAMREVVLNSRAGF